MKVKKSIKKSKKVEVTEPSEGTLQIVKLAKKLASATSETRKGKIIVSVGDRPIMKITGVGKDIPTVSLRPFLAFNPLIKDEDKSKSEALRFKLATGLKAKFWNHPKQSCSFTYTGPEKLLTKKLKIALPKLRRAVEVMG
jgi:hypothetical protein